jgi:hypothetical protein
MNIKYSIILILFFLLSCTKLENTIPTDIVDNEEKYNQIIETIYQSDFSRFSLNQYISKDYFPKELNELLKTTNFENKVEYLIFFKNSDCEQKSFELKSGGYYVLYNPCPDDKFPKPNSYLREGATETWGINKNWMIWKDNDRW